MQSHANTAVTDGVDTLTQDQAHWRSMSVVILHSDGDSGDDEITCIRKSL